MFNLIFKFLFGPNRTKLVGPYKKHGVDSGWLFLYVYSRCRRIRAVYRRYIVCFFYLVYWYTTNIILRWSVYYRWLGYWGRTASWSWFSNFCGKKRLSKVVKYSYRREERKTFFKIFCQWSRTRLPQRSQIYLLYFLWCKFILANLVIIEFIA